MRLSHALAFAMLIAPLQALAADGNDPASAQALFDQALSDFDAGRVDSACSKFQESMRLDPANGTLLNLARCHERQGKTATAWAEYLDVAALAARAGDKDRAAVAQEAADRLTPTLAMLRIDVAKAAPEMVIMRDGIRLSEASWGQPLPIDPGRHRIAAIAPGWQTVTLEVDIAPKDTMARVAVPELVPAPIEPAPTQPSSTGPNGTKSGDSRALTIAGVVFGSVGVTAAVVGGVLGGVSLSELSEARDNPTLCPNNVCTPAGRAWVDDAETKGNASTALFVVGGALVATGIVMIVIDLGFDDDDDKDETALQLVPIVGPTDAGMTLQTKF